MLPLTKSSFLYCCISLCVQSTTKLFLLLENLKSTQFSTSTFLPGCKWHIMYNDDAREVSLWKRTFQLLFTCEDWELPGFSCMIQSLLALKTKLTVQFHFLFWLCVQLKQHWFSLQANVFENRTRHRSPKTSKGHSINKSVFFSPMLNSLTLPQKETHSKFV